ncbi:hypothetical protein [Comamonas sp. UBA7528]|jgi:hypothetical protein|uniref:hypothetical protein n=1 Tax=Comamonas sp. UBA7528 TaxID=1946391 RepID=UPI0025C69BFC|nr:hypothetical protein [Comamonas sp. UBA7528]
MTPQPKAPQGTPTGTTINTTRKQQPSDPGAAKLPHERDQSVDMTDGKAPPEMKQAHQDLKRGLKDADARGTDGKPLGSKIPTK